MIPDTSRWSSYPEQLFLLFALQLGVFLLAIAAGSVVASFRKHRRLLRG